MYTKYNLVSLTLILSTVLAISGLALLLAMSLYGLMQVKGFLVGGGFGLCLVLLLLEGREIVAWRKGKKSLARLLVFPAAILAVGLPCCLALPHAGRGSSASAAYLEQVAGVLWALSSAAIYPSFRGYRRLNVLIKLACSSLSGYRSTSIRPRSS